jgi:adenine-specific DNA-methyltransferase
MAAIDDLIGQIEDKALRERLRTETERLTRDKKFGLVFEHHLPELTAIYSAKVRKGNWVAKRGEPLSDFWRVLAVTDGAADCVNRGSGEKQRISVDDLVVVRQFGEPIFPALVPVDRVQNATGNTPWHVLIEADNYHALQLLEYIYAGKVDCIYIDPPYNSGSRDWKYNNDYVDINDNWRHSKWLAFMRRRLKIAKRLLKEDGVLIVTIDENEVYHLGCLLEQLFPSYLRQMVTIVINPKGTGKQNFARVEEHAFFCIPDVGYSLITGLSLDSTRSSESEEEADDDESLMTSNLRFDPVTGPESGLWELRHARRRGSESSYRPQRPNQFYPIYIDEEAKTVVKAGESLPLGEEPTFERENGCRPIWPIDADGNQRCWRFVPATMQGLIDEKRVVLGQYNRNRDTWTLNYWVPKNLVKKPKTVWWNSLHDAGTHGTTLLHNLLARRGVFQFPKSIYAVRDSLMAVVRERKDAIILDFFAGSGTTLHAVHLLNLADQGKRRCVLVTNNEVSENDARELAKAGYRPGDPEWEQEGICQCVTWPRSKYTILGRREDGTPLEGEYILGRLTETERPRKFYQIGFSAIDNLNTVAKKKQLVELIDGIPKSKVTRGPFVVSESHSASILFDETQAEAWLEELHDQKHITDFYIVTATGAIFDNIKARIVDLLGPMTVTEEEKRSMQDGFAANLEYFRLDFLDKDQVALGRQFREILPILWLRSGAIGPRPGLPRNKPLPTMLLPEHNRFAVLLDETRFPDFVTKVKAKEDVTHIYLVTDSEEAFQEMAAQLSIPNVVQLYRDYLENFVINMGEGEG